MSRLKINASQLFLFVEFFASMLFSMMFVVISLYEATVAGLNPLQLVLVGTALEISAFIFEVPTGVVADAYSRRISIIVGYLLMGAGFLVEGLFPSFVPILIAQVIWGLGFTFQSGAMQAWLSDEVGEEAANRLLVRGNRVSLYGSMLGMLLAVLFGGQQVNLPILIGAWGVILIGFVLMAVMPETGFKPTPKEDRNTWQHMAHIFKEGLAAVRARPRLSNILMVGFFFGLYSEGFDRLWVKHLLDTFTLPIIFGDTQVGFFGIMRAGGMLLAILVSQVVEKRLDTGSPLAIGRAMLGITASLSLAIIGFALSPILAVTVLAYVIISMLRNVAIPLYTAWVNQRLDSQTRATVLSMSSQVDAIGQISGGPGVAAIAALSSVVAAISTSGLLLTPALLFVSRANLQSANEAEPVPAD